MAYYLQMVGTGDFIKLPSMTLSRIVADVAIRRHTDFGRVLWDFRTGVSFAYLLQQTNGTDAIGSGSIKVNGATVSNGTAFIPENTRCTIEHTFSSTAADDGNIFSNSSGGTTSTVYGDIFDIKLYNGTTLVAHYDMTLGNVQDQSGNGFHSTLTGGTWMQDGPTGTAYTKILADVISTSDTISKRLTVTVIDTVPTSDSSRKYDVKTLTDAITSADAITFQNGKAVNLFDSIAIVDTISKRLTLKRSDTVTAAESDQEATSRKLLDVVTQADTIIITGGKAVLLSDNIPISDSLRKALFLVKSDSTGLADETALNSSVSIRLYDIVVSSDSAQYDLPGAKKIISRVSLSADRSLRVNLLASREMRIELRGDLTMVRKNQSLEMEAGESRYLDFIATDNGKVFDLTGATIKWAMKKNNTPMDEVYYSAKFGEWFLKKDSIGDGGIEITDAANGKFTIMLLSADTENFPPGIYYHEAYAIDVSNHKSPISSGIITLTSGLI